MVTAMDMVGMEDMATVVAIMVMVLVVPSMKTLTIAIRA